MRLGAVDDIEAEQKHFPFPELTFNGCGLALDLLAVDENAAEQRIIAGIGRDGRAFIDDKTGLKKEKTVASFPSP